MSAVSGGDSSGAGLGALYTNALEHQDQLAMHSKREHWMIWLVIASFHIASSSPRGAIHMAKFSPSSCLGL